MSMLIGVVQYSRCLLFVLVRLLLLRCYLLSLLWLLMLLVVVPFLRVGCSLSSLAVDAVMVS